MRVSPRVVAERSQSGSSADAVIRIWRSAWAWMPVDASKGLFRIAWVAVSLVGLAALIGASVLAVLA